MSKDTKNLGSDALIAKYGKDNLRKIDIPVNDSETEFLEDVAVIVPNRNVMGQFQKWQDMNPKKASEILVKGCVVQVSDLEVIMGNDFMFNTTVGALSELIPIGNARIKKF
jgi:hypothetical protein